MLALGLYACSFLSCIFNLVTPILSVYQLAEQGALCDYGLYLGAGPSNVESLKFIAHQAVGLKMYLNETFTTLQMNDVTLWSKVKIMTL